MGHYLRDNSQMIYFNFSYKPIRTFEIKTYFSFAQHGPDYDSLINNRAKVKFMENIEWESKIIGFEIKTQVINNLYAKIEYYYLSTKGNTKFTNPLFLNNVKTLSTTINYKF